VGKEGVDKGSGEEGMKISGSEGKKCKVNWGWIRKEWQRRAEVEDRGRQGRSELGKSVHLPEKILATPMMQLLQAQG
jgi:hypothetical protein